MTLAVSYKDKTIFTFFIKYLSFGILIYTFVRVLILEVETNKILISQIRLSIISLVSSIVELF